MELGDFTLGDGNSIDRFLRAKQEDPQADEARLKKACAMVPAGTRVAFKADIQSVLLHSNIPAPNVLGTVICVRTASGDTTHRNGYMMVNWDDGVMRPSHITSLRVARASKVASSNYMFNTNGLGDLSGFFKNANDGSTDLVHKATKDLWAFKETKNGPVLQRLFNEQGEPLKG